MTERGIRGAVLLGTEQVYRSAADPTLPTPYQLIEIGIVKLCSAVSRWAPNPFEVECVKGAIDGQVELL